jgi:hypothetical protein
MPSRPTAPLDQGSRLPWILAVTTFLGAFLLFQVQPLIGKYILPWFGGGASVWSTCLLFFQVIVFAGYAYAHLTTRFLTARSQVVVHLALLAVSLALLPVVPGASWQPDGVAWPSVRILCLLTMTLGLPCLLLSATSPLLQAWGAASASTPHPYRLFAYANGGSLVALLTYPVVVEPALSRAAQATLWSVAFGCFVLLTAGCVAWRLRRCDAAASRAGRTDVPRSDGEAPFLGTWLLWLGFSAVPVILLMAVTNQMSNEVAPIPFLWVVFLALYLLSFVICFGGLYRRSIVGVAFVLSLAATYVLLTYGAKTSPLVQLCVYSAVLLACCTLCHGELYGLRPAVGYLTHYYLSLAAGGALGGALVVIVAPVVFDRYVELHVGLVGCAVLVLAKLLTDAGPVVRQRRLRWVWACLAGGLLGLGEVMAGDGARDPGETVVAASRNFYGQLRLSKYRADTPWEYLFLRNGSVSHGLQFTRGEKRGWATAYYSKTSAVGILFQRLPKQSQRRIGVVGLGAGTLAAYGKPGDYIRFYEINPDVIPLATERFSFIGDSPARVDVVQGDARLLMQREEALGLDVLVLDAFTGGTVPVHLLTREAFETYQRHLGADGVIAVHVSSRWFTLRRVVRRLGEEFGLTAITIIDPGGNPERWSSEWILLTGSEAVLGAFGVRPRRAKVGSGDVPLWTDDYVPLLRTFDFGGRALQVTQGAEGGQAVLHSLQ